MSLTRLSDDYTLVPHGMINDGVKCWFNSCIQACLSCTSLTEYLMSNEQRYVGENNIVVVEYIKLIKKNMTEHCSVVLDPTDLYNAFMQTKANSQTSSTFGQSQEDAGEGLLLFLETMNDPDVYKYFTYRYLVKIWCVDCDSECSRSTDESCILEIPLQYDKMIIRDDDLSVGVNTSANDDINEYIRQHIAVLEDYSCEKCGSQNCRRIYQLTRAPDVIIIMFNKFYGKKEISFSDRIKFASSDGGGLIYKHIVNIEHSGGIGGGHYWVQCHRRKQTGTCDMYNINDEHATIGSRTPTAYTYIAMYHYI